MSPSMQQQQEDSLGQQPLHPDNVYDPYSLISRQGHDPLLHSHSSKSLSDTLDIAAGRKKMLGAQLILPTLLVVVGTAGIASLLLGWILSHETQSSVNQVWNNQAFLLDEGTRLDGGLEAGRLTGLTISSAASTVVGFTTPVLIGLYGFRIAHAWLNMSNAPEEDRGHDLPTPLQYGLMVSILSATGLGSITRAARYMFKKSTLRPRVSSLLNQTFAVVVAIYVITHAVSGVDLWLHSVTATVIQPTTSPINTPFQFSVAQNTCLPYPDPWYEAINPCLFEEGGWGFGLNPLTPGMLVTSNSSDDLQTITLANNSDLAVLVRPRVEQSLAFVATSFGARAQCASVNALCFSDSGLFENCTGFPSSFPPVNPSDLSDGGLSSGQSTVFIQSSNCAYGQNCTHISSSDITNDASALDPTQPEPVNVYSMWMQFLWRFDGDQSVGDVPPNNTAMTLYSNMATMLVNCTVQFYNVTLNYSNGSYALVNEDLSNVGLSDGLAGPSRLGHYATHLISNVEGHAFSDNTTDLVMAFLQQDLARLALGSAAIITNLAEDTLSQSSLSNRILGRYPFWPVVIILILLYAHSVLALLIFITTALFVRSDQVRIWGSEKTVSALQLARLRLVNPLPLVASLFPPLNPTKPPSVLSAQTDAMRMFAETAREEPLLLGLHEDDSENTVFGVWRRVRPDRNYSESIASKENHRIMA